MVIGNGMIARKFDSYNNTKDYIIFASGVSNSKSTDIAAYNREFELLSNIIKEYNNKTLVYFSTCSLFDPDESESPYIHHKRRIEEYIQKNTTYFHIFRVSNLVGKSSNYNTILNFFYYHIEKKINFDLWCNSSRNLIDIDDMYLLINYILQNGVFKNQVINVANPYSYSVKNIVRALELSLQMKANYISIEKGSQFLIDVSLILPIVKELKINFDESYLNDLINKYYQHK